MYQQTIIKKTKKDYQKNARERYQNLSIEEKEKKAAIWSGKVSQKMKNKSLFSIEKTLQNEEKRFIIIIRNYYFKK